MMDLKTQSREADDYPLIERGAATQRSSKVKQRFSVLPI
jgi:hypothetical protein